MLIGLVFLATGLMPLLATDHADHQPGLSSMATDHGHHDNHCMRHNKGDMPSSDADCCAQPGCNPLLLNTAEPSVGAIVQNGSGTYPSVDVPSFLFPPIVPPPRA
jgi:hypothetical protein